MKKFLLLIVATIFFAGCANDEPPVNVTAEKILSADGNLTINHDGKISLSDELQLHTPIAGNVIATYFEDGQFVEENQPLFKIGKQQDEADFLQAKAKLSETMTTLARELSELRQAEMLLQQNKITAPKVDEKKFAVEERQAELEELQRRVKELEEISAAGTIKAPISGTIGGEHVKLGAQVSANDLIATIGKNNPVNVRFEISQEEKQIILSSDSLKVLLKLGDGTTREGKLKFPDASTAEAIFDNPDGKLISGNAARVELDGLKISKTLLVPEKAIFKRDGENFVFVVAKNKTAEEKKISLGGKIGTYFIVTDGLKADDSVVVEDLTKLREGTPLFVTNDK